MISEIFIEGQPTDINADLSSLLTFAIDDIKDFASRSTVYSKTVVLPGTARNNALFGNIFDTGISNDYDPDQDNINYNFNASKSARCYIFQDNLQAFKGTVRLLEIIIDKGRIEYEVALNGELTSLSIALTGRLLEDLDFSEYNEAWNETNIVASWDNPGGSGIYYPTIDYGTYSVLKHDWDFRTFRPALYVKEYIDKMFAAANFRYTCDLFETDRFKKLIIPHNQKTLIKVSGNILEAIDTTGAPGRKVIDFLNGVDDAPLEFTSVTGGLFTYSGGQFTYTGTETLATTLKVNIPGNYTFIRVSPPLDARYECDIMVRKNGVAYYTMSPNLSVNTPLGSIIPYTWTFEIPLTLATGDTFDIYYLLNIFDIPGGTFGDALVYELGATLEVLAASTTISPVDYNEEIDLRYAIPKNVRQVDFLLSIVKLFNLYVYEDQFDERLIKMAPFIDFYSTDSGAAIDWTYKMDRNNVVRVKPMSELNSKIYNFKYRDDGDFWNDLYKKRYNVSYGSHVFDSQYEFSSQTNSLELIFAGTPLVGFEGEEKVYPTIYKSSAGVEERIDSVIRIMQSKKISGVASWDIKNDAAVLSSQTVYGYAGHFDDPDNPDNDLNFGVLQELFFILVVGDLSKTQFNLYWSSYMAEITDKDSKLLTAKFYLTPKDIFNLNFATYITVDNVLFRLNKITDYNATYPDLCTVELLKVINTGYGFPAGELPPSTPDNFLLWSDGDALLYDDGLEILYN